MAGLRKATHKGSCQVCGREQKLPFGRLSMHGYTTKWGFFSGICPGAEHLPFEQSKDLIEEAIASARKKIIHLEEQIATLRMPPSSPLATCYVYRSSSECLRHEKAGYLWVSGRIERREPRHGQRFVVIAEDGREYYIGSERISDTELMVAAQNNKRYANSLQKQIEGIEDYIRWQENRILNWAPQPLQPI